jgi:hypothetical protein
MLSDSVATAVMTASITGAGLVIAFYALLARMSDRIFAVRFEQLDERRRKVKQISNNPDSFNEENLKKTTSQLEDLEKEIHSMKAFPKYLGVGVMLNFLFFLFTAIISFLYVTGSVRSAGSDTPIIILFIVSLVVFFGVGIYGIFDVNEAISGNFEKLKKQKEEIKEEITNAPEEVRITSQIESILLSMNLRFEKTVPVKAEGIKLVPDFVIPSANNPKYVIEAWSKPTYDLVNNLSWKYMRLSESNIKTIFITNFENNENLLKIAENYWDDVIDLRHIEKLRTILGK